MTGTLDRIETWGRGLVASKIGWGHKVLALVEVAKAAQPITSYDFAAADHDYHGFQLIPVKTMEQLRHDVAALAAALARLEDNQ